MSAPRWLLLIHAIPPEPAYFRVKVRRRLRKLGALALKNSVYLLPNTDEALEDLRWLAQEIRADGGEAIVTTADVVDGPSVEELSSRLGAADGGSQPARGAEAPVTEEFRGRTWATRRGMKVDRMSSAWLIRTFIDPDARFEYVADGASASRGAVRFDMFEGEFTHVADRCTFEVLVQRFELAGDAALVALAEIVHDIDCKDDRYGRPEAAGVRLMVDEIVRRTVSDEERLVAGSELFGSLYRGLSAPR